jgi:hypothetical protein
MFTAAKNALAGKAAQVYVNNLISRYGRLQDLKIDTNAKTVEAACLLHGETEALIVKVGRYAIQREGDRCFIQASACSASRPWLQNLLEDHVQGKRIELPAWAAAAL